LAADVYSRNSAIGDFKTKVQQLVVAKQRCVSVDGPLHAVGSRLNRFLDAVRKPDGVDMRVRGPPVCPTRHSVKHKYSTRSLSARLQVAAPPDYDYLKSIFAT
jgi:hypothetical protein